MVPLLSLQTELVIRKYRTRWRKITPSVLQIVSKGDIIVIFWFWSQHRIFSDSFLNIMLGDTCMENLEGLRCSCKSIITIKFESLIRPIWANSTSWLLTGSIIFLEHKWHRVTLLKLGSGFLTRLRRDFKAGVVVWPPFKHVCADYSISMLGWPIHRFPLEKMFSKYFW